MTTTTMMMIHGTDALEHFGAACLANSVVNQAKACLPRTQGVQTLRKVPFFGGPFQAIGLEKLSLCEFSCFKFRIVHTFKFQFKYDSCKLFFHLDYY